MKEYITTTHNVKIRLLLLTCLVFFTLLLSGTSFDLDKNSFPWVIEDERLKTCYTWFSNGIRIEGNWQEICDSYEWCYKEEDTFIIENMTIDAENSRKGIYVENSVEPFIIRNCHIYDSQKFRSSGAIHLVNVQNGLITNNNCSSNLGNGITIMGGANIIVSNNTLSDNGYSGIATYCVSKLTISDNMLRNNGDFGIYHESFACRIEKNRIEFNGRSGIQLFYGENNEISGNVIKNCTEHGIALFESDNNIVQENEISNNAMYGISLEISNKNTIKNNKIEHIDGCLIEKECNNNVFENNKCDPDTGLLIPGYQLLIIVNIVSIFCLVLFIKNKRLKTRKI